MDNLDEILNGDEPVEAVEAAAPEAEEPVEVEAEAPKPARGPDGKFIPKGEVETPQEVAAPATEEPKLEHPALIGERRRRQEAEARLQQLEQHFAQLQQQPVQQQVPQGAPDMFEDPEGYTRYIADQAAQVARNEAQAAFQYQRIEMSAVQARSTLPDYDEKIGVFGQMVETNPALLEQLYRAPNPAEFAYNAAKTQLEISQYGGIDGLIQARVDAALKSQAPAIPTTLADAQSASGSGASYQPPSLEDILGS